MIAVILPRLALLIFSVVEVALSEWIKENGKELFAKNNEGENSNENQN
jgi:hypothetical protein